MFVPSQDAKMAPGFDRSLLTDEALEQMKEAERFAAARLRRIEDLTVSELRECGSLVAETVGSDCWRPR